MRSMQKRQRGITLFMAMIMLVVLTLAAVTAFNLGSSSMQIVGNFQHRNDGLAAAQEAIEQALSTTRLVQAPGAIFLTPCSGANTTCVDVNGDGTNDVTVALVPTPTCVMAYIIKSGQLNYDTVDGQKCSVGPPVGTGGIKGVPTGNSLCANSIWEVRAEATDNATQSKVTVVEGVSVRPSKDDIASYCP
jgi:Tfp pilus assembly protein PilX